jgi:hypothetical protein
MNKLARLILEHLDAAAPYMVPEPGLFSDLRQLVRPVAEEQDWTDAIYLLLQKEFIGFQRDEISDEKKFFIKEAGQSVLRRA